MDSIKPELQSRNSNYQDETPITIDASKLSKLDHSILAIAKAEPGLTQYQIGNKLTKFGLCSSPTQIYTRMHRNQYLKAEFDAVRKNVEQQIVRELAPLAVKNVRKHLKDKTLHARDQFAYNKLVLDKTTADRKDGHNDSPISIGSVQQLQVVFQGTLLDDNAGQDSK
jgi:hypothetical protein